MQENSRYAVGIDVGTTKVRCVVAHVDDASGTPTIVGVGAAQNTGMRKGVVVHLHGPSNAIDDALGEAERMSGHEVDDATLSINGAHIISVKADGMIAAGAPDHEISTQDIARVEEVATLGKVPANREVLEVVPYSFSLDGQDNIKDPIGMTGTRLEINANIVSGLTPHLVNLRKVADMAKVHPNNTIVASLAAARAVLTESQLESGVAVVDMGGATTSVAIYEEGDLQHVGVVPYGGTHVTNDLAIGLKTDPEIAEQVKIKHASALVRDSNEGVSIKQGDDILSFQTSEIDEIVSARLEEIFEAVQEELKKAGRNGKLPSGVVLTGGGANMHDIVSFVRASLGVAVRVGKPTGFSGVDEKVKTPDFASAVGLMFYDMEQNDRRVSTKNKGLAVKSGKGVVQSARSTVQNLFSKFKS